MFLSSPAAPLQFIQTPTPPGAPDAVYQPLQVKVGQFIKTTAAAPASQSVTVGFSPKALIMWTMGGIADNTFVTQATASMRMCVGLTTGPGPTENIACAAVYSTTGGPAGGRRSTRQAFMLINDGATAAVALAALASFDSDGFTLSWTTNDANASIIHYLAFGGTDVQAKALVWSTPVGAGSISTTGAGFKPNAVFMLGSANSLDTTQIGTSGFRFGAAVSPSSRWAQVAFGDGATLGHGSRGSFTNRALVSCTPPTAALTFDADFVSFDTDGITLNSVLGGIFLVGVLFLKIPNVAVGTFSKPTGGGPAVGSVACNFPPSAVLLATVQKITDPNITVTGAKVGLSAFTAGNAEAAAFSFPDSVTPITYAGIDKTGKAALKLDNNTPALDAETTGVLTSTGFDLTWNANDAIATEWNYLAIGDYVPVRRVKPRVYAPSANQGRLSRGAVRRRVG